ncbi:2-C-methyl-D-erythritol 4-phosphate cytidylyltransferase [Clostridium boliviensis]|uniref:2-C-methyl-D-erythritol 4-phosphate cytidylyltransferase n=1 Tax=Clostridium boliviensis TaxID=318465 RepID=A0ABU4GPM8_9CLOT|nr:2-C-methyl-D-erythritol 4-phosphate cytidylyltransferase [Clostridium boliviensis]MDW2799586.1 2-C-methyl-D-erythritol 4-phosphate cytidylyltransferase [Clostridium boliviensis]
MERTAAVVLAAGKGTRMGSQIHKQYMELCGKPLLYYTLRAFEESSVDEIVLVTGPGEVSYCQNEIADRYGFRKVSCVTEGGKERYHSVYAGLKAVRDCAYVLIHDGARPCVTKEIIDASKSAAIRYGACVVGMPVKDTIKVSDENGYAAVTPDRNSLWQIQTPQAFRYDLVFYAYTRLMDSEQFQKGVTDDAMVVETMTKEKVKLIQGDYTNIKVTTPEDLEIAGVFLNRIYGNR